MIEIDLDQLKPLINGPHSPDRAHRVGADGVGAQARENGWPLEVSAALIGSCTNSSYEDITRAASIARQAAAHGLTAKTELLITPGSEQIRATIERDGLLADLEAVGATVLANACGPCIGQWSRPESITGQPNTIVNSFNRNFPKRNDGSANTLSFVTSPDTVMAIALAGRLDFDPTTDTITAPDGTEVRLEAPVGEVLPDQGLRPRREHVHRAARRLAAASTSSSAPRATGCSCSTPFPAWDGEDYHDLPVLMKAQGKCTTDHISAAGPWLKYRGHLENISGNLFLGVVNAYTGAIGKGLDITDGETRPFPEIAKRYHEAGIRWVAIGDRNYGEGSSREHAAMEPRFRGGVVILARSFARIHETNLKKQGLVPLTFADPDTYDQIGEDDRINVLDLPPVPGQQRALPDRQARRLDRRLRGAPHVQRRAGRVVQGRLGAQHRARQGRSPARTTRMDLREAIRTTGSVREFRDEPVRGRARRERARRRPLRAVGRQPPAVAGGARRRTRASGGSWRR